MRRFGLLISGVFLAIAGFAENEFGRLDDVRAKYPQFFKPGVVSIATLGQEDWYVYCGDAEKCLKSETEDELYEEAQVQAKMNFFNYFAKKDPLVKVDVVGARRMYQCADKEFRFVVMGVPVKGVTVKPGAQKIPAGGKTASPVESNSVVIAENKYPKASTLSNAVVSVSKTPVSKPDTEVASQAEIKQPTKAGKTVLEKIPEGKESAKHDNDDLSDDEKLDILRKRMASNPNDYRVRIRMARIFARQGKVRRAFNNFNDAARMLISDASSPDGDKAENLLEIAQYEEFAKEYSYALKHYRMVLKMGNRDQVRKANDRISSLLLKF